MKFIKLYDVQQVRANVKTIILSLEALKTRLPYTTSKNKIEAIILSLSGNIKLAHYRRKERPLRIRNYEWLLTVMVK